MIDSELFSGERIGEVAILRFKENLLLRGTDLSAKDRLFSHMDHLAQDPGVKTLLIVGSPEKTGSAEYIAFYKRIIDVKVDINHLERLYNAVNQFILKLKRLDKIIVSADSGVVIPLYLNFSLACDYRIIGDNTRFEFPYHQIGLIPKGGSLYFFTKLLGQGKALEILLSKEPLCAEKALEYGIVQQVVPAADVETVALETAHRFSDHAPTTLWGLKRMMNQQSAELQQHLEFENETLRLIIRNKDFQTRLSRC